MKFKNIEMEQMLMRLKPLLSQRNKIGYIAARNTRILGEALTEYFHFKNQLIEKYGERDKDQNGKELPTISIRFDSPNFEQFDKELSEFTNIEHDVNLMTLKYEEVIGFLTGEEILALGWMFQD